MMTRLQRLQPAQMLQLAAAHAMLLAYTALALFPVVLVIINSVKSRRAIFKLSVPISPTISSIAQ